MKNSTIQPYSERNAQDNFEYEEAYLRAKKRVEKLVGFYRHLAIYLVINSVIIGVNAYYSNNFGFNLRTFSTALFWGIGLLFHFLGVFGPNFMFGKAWEKRKIEQYLENDTKRWE